MVSFNEGWVVYEIEVNIPECPLLSYYDGWWLNHFETEKPLDCGDDRHNMAFAAVAIAHYRSLVLDPKIMEQIETWQKVYNHASQLVIASGNF
jgi:hypothetical protein